MTDAQPTKRKRRRRRRKKPPPVRRGVVGDVVAVVELIVAERADRVERGAHRAGLGEINADHLCETIRRVAEAGGLIVAEDGGEVVGACAMTLAPSVFNYDHINAVVFSILVAPGARQHGIGSALLDAAEECARASGAAGLNIGSHWDGQNAARRYLERGHRLCESYYLKDL